MTLTQGHTSRSRLGYKYSQNLYPAYNFSFLSWIRIIIVDNDNISPVMTFPVSTGYLNMLKTVHTSIINVTYLNDIC